MPRFTESSTIVCRVGQYTWYIESHPLGKSARKNLKSAVLPHNLVLSRPIRIRAGDYRWPEQFRNDSFWKARLLSASRHTQIIQQLDDADERRRNIGHRSSRQDLLASLEHFCTRNPTAVAARFDESESFGA